MHYRPKGDPWLLAGQNRLTPYVISAEYNSEHFSLTGEYTQAKHDSRDYGVHPLALGLQKPNTVEGWYLQAIYRPVPDWNFYLRRDEIYLDKRDKNGAKVTPPLSAHNIFAKDWTLGARYDWDNWAFSAECHKVNGTLWMSPLDTSYIAQKQKWDMILLQAAWRF